MLKTLYRTGAALRLSCSGIACGIANADRPGPTYDKRIFTQFAEHLGAGIYGGFWVGNDRKIANTNGFRNDVVAALRQLSVPMMRGPGGCFADEYHWRDGIGPKSQRPVKVNTNWAGVTEPNTVGTHEYYELLRQVGAEAYISGNVGNGTPQEMAEWVEYMTSPARSLADHRARNGQKQPWSLPFLASATNCGAVVVKCARNTPPTSPSTTPLS